MSVKATEIGKTIRCAAGFDMSNKTSVTATITDSDGTEVTVADSRITIPGSGYTDADLGAISANEYAQFTTLSTDFPSAGTYSIYLTYNATGQTFYSDAASITVTAKGS